MKCPRCGFVQSATQQTCRYCGSKLTPSVLIPFPKTRLGSSSEAEPPKVPEWRVELRERVRAIRARKGLPPSSIPAQSEPVPSDEPVRPTVAQAPPSNARTQPVRRSLTEATERARAQRQPRQMGKGGETLPSPHHTTSRERPAAPSSKAPDQAARERLQDQPASDDLERNNAVAARAEPRRDPLSVSRDVAATSSGSLPEPALSSRISVEAKVNAAQPASASANVLQPERVAKVRSLPQDDWPGDDLSDAPDWPSADVTPLAETPTSSGEKEGARARQNVTPLSQEIADPIRPAGFFRRLGAGLIDVGVIAFTCVPFVSCVELAGANLADRRVLLLLGIVAAAVGFLYLSVLLTMAGRTIGMAAVGLLALDARTMDLPSFFQVVLRALGFLLGIALVGSGLFWSLVDRERRTFSDLLSRTVVRCVSDSIYDSQQVRAPWLYRPGRR